MKAFNKVIKQENYEMELYQDEGGLPKIQIRKDNGVQFLPTISVDYPFRETNPTFKDFKLEIQTTSYGALDEDQFEEFLENQKLAFQAVKFFKTHLNEYTPEYVEAKMETY